MDYGIKFKTKGKIWRYPGPAGWYFVNVGKKASAQIKQMGGVRKVGWGYIRIRANIGKTAWETTLFPAKQGQYMIAVKAGVRNREKLQEDDNVEIEFELI